MLEESLENDVVSTEPPGLHVFNFQIDLGNDRDRQAEGLTVIACWFRGLSFGWVCFLSHLVCYDSELPHDVNTKIVSFFTFLLSGRGYVREQMIITPHLLEWIRLELDRRQWTVAEFAKHTKTTRTGWVRILNAENSGLRAKAVGDLCEVFGIDEIDLYQIAHPERAGKLVKEPGATYSTRDKLLSFIEGDMRANPQHRSAYEAIALAFGYDKGKKP